MIYVETNTFAHSTYTRTCIRKCRCYCLGPRGSSSLALKCFQYNKSGSDPGRGSHLRSKSWTLHTVNANPFLSPWESFACNRRSDGKNYEILQNTVITRGRWNENHPNAHLIFSWLNIHRAVLTGRLQTHLLQITEIKMIKKGFKEKVTFLLWMCILSSG